MHLFSDISNLIFWLILVSKHFVHFSFLPILKSHSFHYWCIFYTEMYDISFQFSTQSISIPFFVTFWWSLWHQKTYQSVTAALTKHLKTQWLRTTIIYYSLCSLWAGHRLADQGLAQLYDCWSQLIHLQSGGINWTRLSLLRYLRIEWWLCFKLGLAHPTWQGQFRSMCLLF